MDNTRLRELIAENARLTAEVRILHENAKKASSKKSESSRAARNTMMREKANSALLVLLPD